MSEPRIHPTAVIAPSAQIAGSVRIGPYCVIGPAVEIGADTVIDSHVVLHGPMTVGRANHVYPFAVLGELSQDMTAKPDDATRVVIGDRNTIREYVTIQRGTLKQQGLTQVGDDNWIMAHVHIAHDCIVGSHTIMANNVALSGHIVIGDWAVLGGYTLIHQFCRLGAHCFTGGGAVLRRDVPPFVMVEGHPAQPRGINTEGLKRRGFSPAEISAVKDAYKLIYLSGMLMADVKTELARLAAQSPAVRQMLHFIESSKRALQR